MPPQPPDTRTPFPSPFGARGYFGGKDRPHTLATIINQMPPHRRYVELFLGGGAIMRNKRPAEVNEALELDLHAYTTWAAAAPDWLTVRNADALLWLRDARSRIATDAMVFADPPYLLETLRGPRCVEEYQHWLTYSDHVQLLQALRALPCMVMVCALPNMLYENMLHDWRSIQYNNTTRNGIQVEQLWCNYPQPTELHDYRYTGATYRRRERIARVRRSFQALSPLERKAVLATMQPAP